jgi:hypothetical protein
VIEGIACKQTDKYLVATVSELSEELKDVIRSRFSAICHGEQNSLQGRGNYTYLRTVKEFLKRIGTKSNRVQTGMLGELMIHVLTSIVYPGYKTIVPYFNLEERNIKKGFDSIIYSADIGIWAYEVKSSRQLSFKGDVDKKTKSLLKVANDDLSEKLKQQDEVGRLWGSAMNGFQVACGHLKDEKKVLEEIILDYQDEARTPECGPEDHNVILSSVLFSGVDQDISAKCIVDKHAEYAGIYKKLLIFAVHKSITIDLLAFLEQEVTDEVA